MYEKPTNTPIIHSVYYLCILRRCDAHAHHVTRHNMPIHNILSTAPQFSIFQKAVVIAINNDTQSTKRQLLLTVLVSGILCMWPNQLSLWALNLKLPTTTIVAPPSNASKWQMGFNSAFKGMHEKPTNTPIIHSVY